MLSSGQTESLGHSGQKSRLQSVLPKLVPTTSWESERGQNVYLVLGHQSLNLSSCPKGLMAQPQTKPRLAMRLALAILIRCGWVNTVIPLAKAPGQKASSSAAHKAGRQNLLETQGVTNAPLGWLLLKSWPCQQMEIISREMESGWATWIGLKRALIHPWMVEPTIYATGQTWWEGG